MRKFSEGKITEKALYIKSGHTYECVEVDGRTGKVKVFFDKTGILGANDKHISWDEIDRIQKSIVDSSDK
jgi:hypothetical protein